jgi:hypothetical protein
MMDIDNDINEVDELKQAFAPILESIEGVSESTKKIQDELHDMHRLYHNEFSGRLRAAQEKLEQYHEIEMGRVFDDVLREIAKLYVDNAAIVDEIEDERLKKRLNYMFLDMLQLLESKDVFKQESKVGDKRNTKFCQVMERIPAETPEEHDTVAKSRSIGFYTENRALIKEVVDVYLYQNEEEADNG